MINRNSKEVYTSLNKFIQVWTSLCKFEQLYTSLSKFLQVWTSLYKFEHIQARLDKFIQGKPSLEMSGIVLDLDTIRLPNLNNFRPNLCFIPIWENSEQYSYIFCLSIKTNSGKIGQV